MTVKLVNLTTHAPGAQPGIVYVVSRVTASAMRGRDDLVFPLDEVRDRSGVIAGCRTLGRFAAPSPEPVLCREPAKEDR